MFVFNWVITRFNFFIFRDISVYMIFYVFASGNLANHQKCKAPQGLAQKEIM